MGKGDDLHGLEDGIAEDGVDLVALVAEIDFEVGVIEDEEDDVVERGSADLERGQDGGLEGVFESGEAGAGLGVAGQDFSVEFFGEAAGDCGVVGAGVEEPFLSDAVYGEFGDDGTDGVASGL